MVMKPTHNPSFQRPDAHNLKNRIVGHPLLVANLIFLSVLLVGTAGYMTIEGQSFVASLYMTAITVTTVGYREAFPLSPQGQLFTMVLAFAGVGVILLIAAEFGRVLRSRDDGTSWERLRVPYEGSLWCGIAVEAPAGASPQPVRTSSSQHEMSLSSSAQTLWGMA